MTEYKREQLIISVNVPIGYRAVDYRILHKGDKYLLNEKRRHTTVIEWPYDHDSLECHVVVEAVEVWRPATVKDVIHCLNGGTVKARFRDNDKYSWHLSDKVLGCAKYFGSLSGYYWLAGNGERYRYCEIKST